LETKFFIDINHDSSFKGKKLKVLMNSKSMKRKNIWTPYKIWNETEWYRGLQVNKMRIEKYSFGSITINGKTYSNDVIIFPDRVKINWRRREGHKINIEDLEEIIKEKPKKLIIGTGAYGMVAVPAEVKEKLRERGIKFEILKTEEACHLFNKEKGAVAALHLTC